MRSRYRSGFAALAPSVHLTQTAAWFVMEDVVVAKEFALNRCPIQ